MGADGHIHIWSDEVVRKEFPDCDKLFNCLPLHYKHELDGKKYHHCYYGDNIWCDYESPKDWYEDDEVDIERLKKFVDWLKSNAIHWEVWT